MSYIPAYPYDSINLGVVSVKFYSITIILAFVALYINYNFLTGKNINQKLITGFLLSILLGSRIYHILTSLPYYFPNNLKEIIRIDHGGLSIIGSIIGGYLYLLYQARIKNLFQLYTILDPLFLSLPIGQAIGRFGNYFNQELYGKPTSLPWKLEIDSYHRLNGYEAIVYYHPTFLYESILSLLIFFNLLTLYFKKPEIYRQPYLITYLYLTLYSLTRILMETLRIDPTPNIIGLRFNLLLALLSFVIFFTLTLLSYSKIAPRKSDTAHNNPRGKLNH